MAEEGKARPDITALTSFVISLTSFAISAIVAIYNFTGYLRGAEPSLSAPDKVYLIAWDYGGSFRVDGAKPDPASRSNRPTYLRIAATMGYVNTGQSGYNSVVQRENVTVRLPDSREFLLVWTEFTKMRESPGSAYTRGGEKGSNNLLGLFVDEMVAAHPTVIVAGNAEAHQTFFSAMINACRDKPNDADCANRNYLPVDDAFQRALDDAAAKNQTIRLTFRSYYYGRKQPDEKTCDLRASDFSAKDFVTWGWTEVFCAQT
jgi:hypothetical protein